jgi:pimeloyl-ACP methyl ester carboxylesterase
MKASLDDLHLTQPLDLVGWSYGGLIALDFAFDNPDRVRTLSLIEPPAFWAQGRQEENDGGYSPHEEASGDITVTQLQDFVCALGNCPSSEALREDPQWQARVAQQQALRGL